MIFAHPAFVNADIITNAEYLQAQTALIVGLVRIMGL